MKNKEKESLKMTAGETLLNKEIYMRTGIKPRQYFGKFFELQQDDLNYYEKFIHDETLRVAKLSDWIQTGKVVEGRIAAIKSTIFLNSLHTVIAKYSYGENPKDLVDEFLAV
ncbi:MAG: DUF1910 domain-containing protein, partial [Helicobacteraceae bacterium]|nr:DUF1910 domain-containing protein [Helicobacteraceae bacterium]